MRTSPEGDDGEAGLTGLDGGGARLPGLLPGLAGEGDVGEGWRSGGGVVVVAGGLEGAEFAEGAVLGEFVLVAEAGEALEAEGFGGVAEGVVGVDEEVGFLGGEAHEVPLGSEELVEEVVLKLVGGLDVGEQAVAEAGEGGLFAGTQGDGDGSELGLKRGG